MKIGAILDAAIPETQQNRGNMCVILCSGHASL